MYNFSIIQDVSQMKDVCMYIRAYNKAKQDKKSLQESDLINFISDTYNKQLELVDIYFLQNTIKELTGSDEIPEIDKLDNLVNEYTKYIKNKVESTVSNVNTKFVVYNEKKHHLDQNISYSSRELNAIEEPLTKKIMSTIVCYLLVSVFSAVAFALLMYPIINFSGLVNVKFFANYLQKFNVKAVGIILIGFAIGLIISLIVCKFIMLGKKYKLNVKLLNLIAENFDNIFTEESEYLIAVEDQSELFNSIKYISVENGKCVGEDKLFYFLRMDQVWQDKQQILPQQQSEYVKEFELKNKVVAINDLGKVKIQSWADEQASCQEKVNMNKDLLARVALLTDSLKKANKSNSTQFDELSNIYLNELSSDNRSKNITKQDDQLKCYGYYVSVCALLEPYEYYCKNNIGYDYESENYSYRVATEQEKADMLNYIYTIAETKLGDANCKPRIKKKVLALYNNIKEDKILKVTKRTDLYKMYFKFLDDVKNYLDKE